MRATGWLRPSALLFLLLLAPRVSHADIAVGATAPAYTKTALGGSTSTLSQYSGKVVVLFLLGYDCPFCKTNCPSVQTDIQNFYQQSHPGQLQVIGADLWNGTATQLNQFKNLTGAQFPLLLNGALATGGNLSTLYGPFDNFVVIDQGGVVRYHAALTWSHGDRYHLNEIRAVVDGLLGPPLSVPPGAGAGLALAVAPHPTRGPTRVAFTLPRAESEVAVEVLDMSGRRIAQLYRGSAAAGELTLQWDGRDASGRAAPAGLYLVRANAGGQARQQRVALLR